jgi:hypothetical protein
MNSARKAEFPPHPHRLPGSRIHLAGEHFASTSKSPVAVAYATAHRVVQWTMFIYVHLRYSKKCWFLMVSVCFGHYVSFLSFLAGFQFRVKHMQETHGFLRLGNSQETRRTDWICSEWTRWNAQLKDNSEMVPFQLASCNHWIHWGPKVLKRKAISKAE